MHAPQLQEFARAGSQYMERFGSANLRYATRYVRRYAFILTLTSVFYVFHIIAFYVGFPTWFQFSIAVGLCGIYGGTGFWLLILDGTCRALSDAFSEIDQRLRTALRQGDTPQVRRLARQHGHLSQLAELFCQTFGGFITGFVYTMLLDVSLSIYVNVRPFHEVQSQEGRSLVRVAMERLMAPTPLILLKLLTNAGSGVIQNSQKAAQLLRGHMLAQSQAADDPEYTEILQMLEGQKVDMNMSEYFTLDGNFFIQSVKDIITLLIVLAQFEMADPNAGPSKTAAFPT